MSGNCETTLPFLLQMKILIFGNSSKIFLIMMVVLSLLLWLISRHNYKAAYNPFFFLQFGTFTKAVATSSRASQEHVILAPFLARLHGTEASVQKEDSRLNFNYLGLPIRLILYSFFVFSCKICDNNACLDYTIICRKNKIWSSLSLTINML